MLHHHVIQHDRDRLGGAEIEVHIAQAADVEAGEDAAGGRFHIQVRHLAGQGQQPVIAGCGEGIEGFSAEDAGGNRHILQIFLAAVGGDGHLFQSVFGRLAKGRAGGEQREEGGAGKGMALGDSIGTHGM